MRRLCAVIMGIVCILISVLFMCTFQNNTFSIKEDRVPDAPTFLIPPDSSSSQELPASSEAPSAPAESPPEEFRDQNPAEGEPVLLDVEFISQLDAYPNGCESVSAVMACRYAGIDISVGGFIDNYLPKKPFYYENNLLYGYHPNDFFMGSPYSDDGLGCYAPCIEKAIKKFLPFEYTLKNTTGVSLSMLCRQYIDSGIPVVVWATRDMLPAGEGYSWYLDGTSEIFQWQSNEHCLVLTGYDDSYYYFNDPLKGKVKYEKNLAQTRYEELGKQSLVVYSSSALIEKPESPAAVNSDPQDEGF